MTFITSRYNIKPMLWRISKIVMVLPCLRRTVMAEQSSGSGKSASPDSDGHNTSCLTALGITSKMPNYPFLVHRFASFTLLIAFSSNFAFFALAVLFFMFQAADFAIRSVTIFTTAMFMKLRQQFGLLASGTSFRYDGFRHLLLLIRSKCLEPIAVHTRLRSACFNITSN